MGVEILSIFVEHNIDLLGIELHKPVQSFINIPDVYCSKLQTFMPQLRLIDAVDDVKTIPSMPSEREKNEVPPLIL